MLLSVILITWNGRELLAVPEVNGVSDGPGRR